MPVKDLSWLAKLPMQTCAFCRALHESGQCKYGPSIRRHFLAKEAFQKAYRAELDAALEHGKAAERWSHVGLIAERIEHRLPEAGAERRRGMLYCYLAHEIDKILRPDNADTEVKKRARALLGQFEAVYSQRGET
jgi:hypothetical protein